METGRAEKQVMKHSEKAVALFESGFNCSQAVLMAFAGESGMDSAEAAKLERQLREWQQSVLTSLTGADYR